MSATTKTTAYGVALGGVLVFAGSFDSCHKRARGYAKAHVIPLYEEEGLARLEACQATQARQEERSRAFLARHRKRRYTYGRGWS